MLNKGIIISAITIVLLFLSTGGAQCQVLDSLNLVILNSINNGPYVIDSSRQKLPDLVRPLVKREFKRQFNKGAIHFNSNEKLYNYRKIIFTIKVNKSYIIVYEHGHFSHNHLLFIDGDKKKVFFFFLMVDVSSFDSLLNTVKISLKDHSKIIELSKGEG